MDGEQELKRAWRTELAGLVVLVTGSALVVYGRAFPALSILALVCFLISSVALVFSIQAVRKRNSMPSVLALWGSLLLFLATFVIGFLGYSAGT